MARYGFGGAAWKEGELAVGSLTAGCTEFGWEFAEELEATKKVAVQRPAESGRFLVERAAVPIDPDPDPGPGTVPLPTPAATATPPHTRSQEDKNKEEKRAALTSVGASSAVMNSNNIQAASAVVAASAVAGAGLLGKKAERGIYTKPTLGNRARLIGTAGPGNRLRLCAATPLLTPSDLCVPASFRLLATNLVVPTSDPQPSPVAAAAGAIMAAGPELRLVAHDVTACVEAALGGSECGLGPA